eukprot:6130249-Alexandrium_andersonii.AAC.1
MAPDLATRGAEWGTLHDPRSEVYVSRLIPLQVTRARHVISGGRLAFFIRAPNGTRALQVRLDSTDPIAVAN